MFRLEASLCTCVSFTPSVSHGRNHFWPINQALYRKCYKTQNLCLADRKCSLFCPQFVPPPHTIRAKEFFSRVPLLGQDTKIIRFDHYKR